MGAAELSPNPAALGVSCVAAVRGGSDGAIRPFGR